MELKIEYLPIKALKPYEKNTRKHQKKTLTTLQGLLKNLG